MSQGFYTGPYRRVVGNKSGETPSHAAKQRDDANKLGNGPRGAMGSERFHQRFGKLLDN